MQNIGPSISAFGLDKMGFGGVGTAHWNYTTAALITEALSRGEGRLAEGGALVVETGVHTGRSANDKFVVEEATSKDNIWWGKVNKPIESDKFDAMLTRVQEYLNGREVFVQDCWAGAMKGDRLAVRVINERPWHNLFARNMFIQPTADELTEFQPEFTVVQVPNFEAVPERDGTRSECFILVNFEKRMVLIGGTQYAGEIKKSIFSVLNYMLPARDIMPMHCSINMGEQGDTAVFFGLSGTGKTTLSADPKRELIGDDEHGWSDNGVFNFEGGCYAKVINLSQEAEPEIYATTKMFGTVLENVVMDPQTGVLDLDSKDKTENTRASYPIDFIPNASATGIGGQPKNVIMLTADAFGVLPPIAKLTPEQASYHFLSGYTAKVAGTEKGVTEPEATFSTCFGAPFMPRHPSVYADLLARRIADQDADCWLVNTGWTGGVYGVGNRMPIKVTRALLNAALDGSLNDVETRLDPNFGFEVPVACPGVPEEILNPRETWADKDAYDAKASHLVGLFRENFKQFDEYVTDAIRAAAPKETENA